MVSLVASEPSKAMERRAAVRALLEDRKDTLVVSGLGAPSYDVHAAGDNPANFYLWGAMGSAALVGLGLAQVQPQRSVLVITGDGEQLMGLGGLATIAIARPTNLTIAIIDNGHYGETGMQVSHSGAGLDLAAVAAACGFTHAETISDIASISRIRKRLGCPEGGPHLYRLKVEAKDIPKSLPFRDAVHGKNRLRQHLGLPIT